MKKIFFIILLQIINNAFSQQKLSIGIDGSYTNDLYSHFDLSQSLTSMPLPSGAWSITLRKEISKTVFIESGLSGKYHWSGIRFSQFSAAWFTTESFHAILVPFRVGYKFNLVRGYQLVPSGSIYGSIITVPLEGGRGGGSIVAPSQTITWDYLQNDLDRFFFMTELRVALEKKIGNSFRLSLYYSRTFGLDTVNEINVQYAVNGTPYEGRYTSKGDYWSVGVGIAYILKPKLKAE